MTTERTRTNRFQVEIKSGDRWILDHGDNGDPELPLWYNRKGAEARVQELASRDITARVF